jgi:hypothetical protein
VSPGVLVAHGLDEVTDEALTYLREIVQSRPEGRQMAVGVAAAGRLLEWARWREEFDAAKQDPAAILALMLGDDDKLLGWMRETLPKLEAKARLKVLAKDAGGG